MTSRPDAPAPAPAAAPEGIDLDEVLAALPTEWTLTGEEVVEVTGEDRHSYLDAMTSQMMSELPTGAVRSGLVLDANGRTLVQFDALVLPDRTLLLLADDAAATAATELLAGRTFLADARFRRIDREVLRLHGPAAREVAAVALRLDGALEDASLIAREGSIVARDDWDCVTIVAAQDELGPLREQLSAHGVEQGEAQAFDTWRVVVGRPAWGREIVAPHLPEELGLLPTHVHLAKGCYPGQEAVARMWMLGRPRRRLAVLAGAPGVFRQGPTDATSGVAVTTVAVLPTSIADGDGALALAMVPGSVTLGERISLIGGDVAVVVALPGDSTAPPGHDPAMRRRRDQQRGADRPPTRLPGPSVPQD